MNEADVAWLAEHEVSLIWDTEPERQLPRLKITSTLLGLEEVSVAIDPMSADEQLNRTLHWFRSTRPSHLRVLPDWDEPDFD